MMRYNNKFQKQIFHAAYGELSRIAETRTTVPDKISKPLWDQTESTKDMDSLSLGEQIELQIKELYSFREEAGYTQRYMRILSRKVVGWLNGIGDCYTARAIARIDKNYFERESKEIERRTRRGMNKQANEPVRETPDKEGVVQQEPKEENEVTVEAADVSDHSDKRKVTLAHLTKSQINTMEDVAKFADLYFKSDKDTLEKLKTNMLLIGPTGVGKTHIVDALANIFGAHKFRITPTDLIPLGAGQSVTPTRVALANKLAEHSKIVLHIDELDKLYNYGGSDWTQSNRTEVLGILEREVDWQQASGRSKRSFGSSNQNRSQVDAQSLVKWFRENVFIVGSGTWQDLYRKNINNHNQCPIGFHPNIEQENRSDSNPGLSREIIRESGEIPDEILRRFHGKVQPLYYPDLEETDQLLQKHGLYELAKKAGERLQAEDICWDKNGGLSIINDLKTELLVKTRGVDFSTLMSQYA